MLTYVTIHTILLRIVNNLMNNVLVTIFHFIINFMENLNMNPENSISIKMNEYFRDNIKLSFVSKHHLLSFVIISIVTNDDKVYQFDLNLETFLAFNNNNDYNVKSFVESNILNDLCFKRVIDFKFNLYNGIARTIDGQLYCWKSELFERIDYSKERVNKYLNDKHIIDICCGVSHSLALTNGGEVYAWGLNLCGQIGNGSYSQALVPIKLNHFNNEKVIQISCGYEHSIALTESGRVFSWGYNEFGQLGLNQCFARGGCR